MTSTITTEEVRAALGAGDTTVVDALPPRAYARRHLPGSINLTAEDGDPAVRSALPGEDVKVVVYSTDAEWDRGPGLATRLEV